MSGADLKCQQSANNANLQGTFKAWLSDSTTSASQRLPHNNGPYVRIDGVTIANNWSDLTDGTLLASINIDEFAGLVGTSRVWTGTKYNGNPTQNNCNNWTNSSNLIIGTTGSSGFTDQSWTHLDETTCGGLERLYCVEQ